MASATVSLPVLARRINDAHENCLKGLRHGLQYAIAAGEGLLGAKGQLDHGEFIPWVEDNCDFTRRTASHYIRIASMATLLGANGSDASHLPLEELLDLLSGRQPCGDGSNSSPAETLPWPECIDKLQETVFRFQLRWPPKALDRLPGELRKLAAIMEHGLYGQ